MTANDKKSLSTFRDHKFIGTQKSVMVRIAHNPYFMKTS